MAEPNVTIELPVSQAQTLRTVLMNLISSDHAEVYDEQLLDKVVTQLTITLLRESRRQQRERKKVGKRH